MNVWQKSSFSADAGNCVNVASLAHVIKLRESDAPDTVLTVATATLGALIRAVKANPHVR
ncbi:DUF397 domain-containing protein [Streptomyces sp. NPDC053048]|uniref:DUF397 domain-containing protein n=1 Tax=Streptomyces sp. NPDC053048 TaxID=3365694 RepID=UPI0037CD1D18